MCIYLRARIVGGFCFLWNYMKLSEALKQYIAYGQYKNKPRSMDTYKKHIQHLVLYFHNCEAEAVNLGGIIEYVNAMKELGWDQNSLVQKLCAYKQFFRFLADQGVSKFNVEMIPIPYYEQRFPKIIEEPDYKKLHAAIASDPRGVRGKLILNLLWDTGMRLNELLSLNVNDLDIANRRAVIKTEKSRGVRPTRMIFWTEETNIVLLEYLKLREKTLTKISQQTDALLISLWGRWQAGNRMSQSALGSLLKHLSHKADLGYVANAHRFRHRYGRNLALQGANNSVISDMMGHSNLESTRIYTVMNEQMMQDTYKKYFKSH